jgi:hypothetical protein
MFFAQYFIFLSESESVSESESESESESVSDLEKRIGHGLGHDKLTHLTQQ